MRPEPPLVPFVVQREGEEAAPDNLMLSPTGPGRYRLGYTDEDPRDRDLRGVLWARCSFGEVDDLGKPTGRPQWRMMHPLRQRGTMQALRCQVCAEPARTPLGYIFLAGPGTVDPDDPVILTNQPPVCPRHASATAELCPHLTHEPTVLLTRSAPPRYVFCGSAMGPLASGPGMTVSPCRRHDLGGGVTGFGGVRRRR